MGHGGFRECRESKAGRDVGTISNMGARHFEDTFSLRGIFRNKKDTSLFIAKSWGHVPPVPPVPTYMEVGFKKTQYLESIVPFITKMASFGY